MRHPRVATLGFTLATVLGLGGVAYAGIQSIDTEPAPEVVVPVSTQTAEPDAHGGRHGADDPATQEAGDDHDRTRHGSDDPASHDAGDDHGSAQRGGDDGSHHRRHGADD